MFDLYTTVKRCEKLKMTTNENLSKIAFIRSQEYVSDLRHNVISKAPTSPNKKSYKTFMEVGKEYLYCSCGDAKEQPFCDWTCKLNKKGFKPLKFKFEDTESKVRGICGCKLNNPAKGAFCDSSHKRITDWEKIEFVAQEFKM